MELAAWVLVELVTLLVIVVCIIRWSLLPSPLSSSFSKVLVRRENPQSETSTELIRSCPQCSAWAKLPEVVFPSLFGECGIIFWGGGCVLTESVPCRLLIFARLSLSHKPKFALEYQLLKYDSNVYFKHNSICL